MLPLVLWSCLHFQGLEDQLLGEVVRNERQELEEARDRLVLSIAADKRQLQVGSTPGYYCSLLCGKPAGGVVGYSINTQ